MKQYSDKEMADMNDDKWLVVNGVQPKIKDGLYIDFISMADTLVEEHIVPTVWNNITKYRLHNGPGYKDGITIDTDEKKPTEWVDGLPPIGEFVDINRHDQELIVRKVLGYYGKFIWVSYKDDSRPPETLALGQLKFRPIITPKQITIEAAKKLSVKFIYDAVNHGGLGAVTQGEKLYDVLYDAGMLTLPGESS